MSTSRLSIYYACGLPVRAGGAFVNWQHVWVGSLQDPLETNDYRTQSSINDYNDLEDREGSTPDPPPPLLTLLNSLA